MNLAKGVRYLALALATATLAYVPASTAQETERPVTHIHSSEAPDGVECTPTYCTRQEAPQSLSCEGLEEKVTSVEVNVSISDYMLRLEGVLPEDDGGKCTYFESRVVVGRKDKDRDWSTPEVESEITYAIVNPVWNITKNVLKDFRTKYPKRWIDDTFIHEDGTYQKPGPGNFMGRVKFSFVNQYAIKIHGTPQKYHYMFERENREASYGCVRMEDEVGLLKELAGIVGIDGDIDPEGIDKLLASGKTRWLKFKKPIKISIRKGDEE